MTGNACKARTKFLIALAAVFVTQSPQGGFAEPQPAAQQAGKINKNTWQPGLVSAHAGKFKFYKLPEYIANMVKSENHSGFIKVHATLQVDTKEDAESVESNLPLIDDAFNSYLREVSPDVLRSSTGLDQMRTELLTRINKIIAPHKTDAVLFEQLLTQ